MVPSTSETSCYLPRAIQQLLENPDEAAPMGRRALESVLRTYNWTRKQVS